MSWFLLAVNSGRCGFELGNCFCTGAKNIARLDQIERYLGPDVPRVLCLDDSFATGGQPSEQWAFAKLAVTVFTPS